MLIAVLISLVLSAHAQKQFNITHYWNGEPLMEGEYIQVTLSPSELISPGMKIEVDAPYYADSIGTKNPYCLYAGEVVETYFSNDKGNYVEMQMSPNGIYLVLLFERERYRIGLEKVPKYTVKASTKMPDRWLGEMHAPASVFPPNFRKFNAHAMHGRYGKNRAFLSLYPADETLGQPDFHTLRFFKEVDFTNVMKPATRYPTLWKELMDYSSDRAKQARYEKKIGRKTKCKS